MQDEILSPVVQVVVAPNASVMTGAGTNTYIVGGAASVVIDPAVDDDGYLQRVIEKAGDITAVLVTHRHADHVGGIATLVGRTDVPVRAWGTEPAGGVAVQPLNNGDVVRTGDVALTALHMPGHARDHLCFTTEDGELFAGDVVLGEGTPVIAPPEGDMSAYVETLQRLKTLDIRRIYPGHGPALGGAARVLDGYIEHRLARERAIVEAIGAGATITEIVERAYADTPTELHALAALSARAHLDWLVAKEQIEVAGDKWCPRGVY